MVYKLYVDNECIHMHILTDIVSSVKWALFYTNWFYSHSKRLFIICIMTHIIILI